MLTRSLVWAGARTREAPELGCTGGSLIRGDDANPQGGGARKAAGRESRVGARAGDRLQ